MSLWGPYRKLKDHAARVIHIEAQVEALSAGLEHLGTQLSELQRTATQARDISARARDNAGLATRNQPPKSPFRVLFLVHHAEAWYSLADVYREMSVADDFSTLVASLPRRFPGSQEFKDEDFVHSVLADDGVPHVRFNHPDSFQDLAVVRAFAPDVIFRQSQWDPDVPEAFRTEELSFARLCLVPYEAMSLVVSPVDETERNPVHDCAYERSGWRIFHANSLSRETALAGGPASDPRRHVVTGHPKADIILRESRMAERGDAPFTVLWSPHHSITDEWTRFGTFHQTAFDMVEAARSHPEWHFVLSMHPALVTRMESAGPPLSREFVDRFREEWGSLPNTEVFPGGRYAELFGRSDVLVSDGISWLLEFQLMNRPVVFLERQGRRALSQVGEIAAEGMHRVTSVDDAVQVLESCKAGVADPETRRQPGIMRTLFGEAGAAHRVVQAVREGLAAEKAL